jgi:hypothetical protein
MRQEPMAMPDSNNLYAPPKAQVEDVVAATSGAHEIRLEHIKTEAAIRSIGTLYYLGAIVLCLAAFALGRFVPSSRGASTGPGIVIIGVICLVFGALSFFVARGIRKFQPWARVTSIVFASLGVLSAFGAAAAKTGAPLGIVINAYILYLLLSKKGRRIFESDYPEIVAATPDVKSKTSIVVWIALIVLALVVVGAILAAVANRR